MPPEQEAAGSNPAGRAPSSSGLLAAGGPTTTLWEIRRAGHIDGIAAAPAEYERKVVGFFNGLLVRSPD